ncbi:Replication factor A protein 1 [Coemansia furcata]|uniref:Replication factor A protein 1 n=1 Tax=Coemansia furcata TaxID=417177 RepID=A0ACC1LQ68_9FUNG|nr:Replication factor A protein 1 [Coemansia furcata]
MAFIDIIDAKDVGAHNEMANTTDTMTPSVQDSPQQPAATSKQPRHIARKSDMPYPLRRINELKPGLKNYTIRACIIKKKHIGCQSVAVNLLDDSGKICAFINHEQVDKFSPLLKVDNVYHISQAQICKRKDQFKLVFTDNTTVEQYVEQCTELTDMSQECFDFISISLLEKYKEKQAVDILWIVADIIDAVPIVKGTGNGMSTRRSLMVVDMSGYKVRITLWGHMAMDFSAPIGSVIAFKGARVNSFDGRTLSASEWRLMVVNPDFPTAHALCKWYSFEGRHMEFQSFTNTASTGKSTSDPRLQLVTVAAANSLVDNVDGTIEFFHIRAAITYIQSKNFTYQSCSGKYCAGLVTKVKKSRRYRCEMCNQSLHKFKYSYTLHVKVSDGTGKIKLQCSDVVGELLFGTSANDMVKLQQQTDKVAFNEMFAAAKNKSYVFKCKITSVVNELGTSKIATAINACLIV